MRIPVVRDSAFNKIGPTVDGRDVRKLRTAVATDAQDVRLPSASELKEAGRARREDFLAGLRASLMSGGYTCEPEQLAEAILTRGLDGL